MPTPPLSAISTDDEVSEDVEPELPESARELLRRAVELTRTDVAEIMTPRSIVTAVQIYTNALIFTRSPIFTPYATYVFSPMMHSAPIRVECRM